MRKTLRQILFNRLTFLLVTLLAAYLASSDFVTVKGYLQSKPNTNSNTPVIIYKGSYESYADLQVKSTGRDNSLAEFAAARQMKDPLLARTPELQIQAAAGKLQRLHDDPKFQALPEYWKERVTEHYYETFVAPALKANGIEPPDSASWLSDHGAARSAADIILERLSVGKKLETVTSFLPYVFVIVALSLTAFSFRRFSLIRKPLMSSVHISPLKIEAAYEIRMLARLNIVALVIGTVGNLSHVVFMMVHALVFVSALLIIYSLDKRRHIAWLTILGLLAVIYCPLTHILTRRGSWTIADGIAAIILGIFVTVVTEVKPNQEDAQTPLSDVVNE